MHGTSITKFHKLLELFQENFYLLLPKGRFIHQPWFFKFQNSYVVTNQQSIPKVWCKGYKFPTGMIIINSNVYIDLVLHKPHRKKKKKHLKNHLNLINLNTCY